MHILSLLYFFFFCLSVKCFHGTKCLQFRTGFFNSCMRLMLVANSCWDIVYYLANRYLDRNNARVRLFPLGCGKHFSEREFSFFIPNTFIIPVFSWSNQKNFIVRFRRSFHSPMKDQWSILDRFFHFLFFFYLGYSFAYVSSSAFAIRVCISCRGIKRFFFLVFFIRIHSTTKFIINDNIQVRYLHKNERRRRTKWSPDIQREFHFLSFFFPPFTLFFLFLVSLYVDLRFVWISYGV